MLQENRALLLFPVFMLYGIALHHYERRFGFKCSVRKKDNLSAHLNSLLRDMDLPKV